MLFLWHIISALVYFIGASIILFVIVTVSELFGIPFEFEFLNNPTGVTVTYAIPSFIAYMLIGGVFFGFIDYHDHSKDKPNVWADRMNARNPLHYKTAQKQCLPYIFVALFVVSARGVFWNIINDAIYNTLQEKYEYDTAQTLNMIIFGLISCYFTITLASTMRLLIGCKMASCPKCGNMCSFEYAGNAGEEIRTTTKQKVGQESGYVYESHTTVTTTPKCHVRCHYCGETKIVTDRHRETKVENKD